MAHVPRRPQAAEADEQMTPAPEPDAVSVTDPTSESYARCGAKTHGSGAPCKLPAGHGTDHVGYGKCRRHAGSTPGGRKAAAKERLSAITPRAIGGFDAIERALAILNGLVDALETELEKVKGGVMDGPELHATVKRAREAARDLATIGKLAADAGLDERRVRLEEAKLAMLAATLRAVFADPELGLSVDVQELAVRVTARHLRELPA